MPTMQDSSSRQSRQERRKRILERTRELYETYVAGLKKGAFKRLFTEETKGLYRHFSGAEEDEKPGGRIKRAFRSFGRIFWGFLLALAPARRILYGVAFLLFCATFFVILTTSPGMVLREDVATLSIYSFVIVSFLLALELADKLSARDEIEIARDVQLSLLPPRNPKIKGLEVASLTTPATEVGGDYHDFVELDGQICVAIGDVSGHGLAAGLVMAMAKSAFQAQLLNDPSPAKVLSTVNSIVRYAGDSRTLMTFLYCMIDPASGRMDFANAGHIYPLLSRSSGNSLQWLESSSYPLGVRTEQGFSSQSSRLQPGDIVYLISDGVVEAVNDRGESYGYDRFEQAIRRFGNGKPEKIMESLLQDFKEFIAAGPLEDDMTVIIIRYLPRISNVE